VEQKRKEDTHEYQRKEKRIRVNTEERKRIHMSTGEN
jgi:hypothetical protein